MAVDLDRLRELAAMDEWYGDELLGFVEECERLQAISAAFTQWIQWQKSQGPKGKESCLEYDGEDTEHQESGWVCWLCDYDTEQSALVHSQPSPIDAITQAFAKLDAQKGGE